MRVWDSVGPAPRRPVKEDVFSSTGDPARGTATLGQKFVLSVTAAADGLFSVLFPSSCRFCAEPLIHFARVPVCQACLEKIHATDTPVCSACGERIGSVRDGGPKLCLNCSQEQPEFTRAAAYGPYDEGMRDLIHLLKYDHVRPAANLLGRMLAEVIAELAEDFTSEPVVIPVPLHTSKFRQRGFNQSDLIARASLKLHPAALNVKVNTSALKRKKNTGSQTGLTPAQRRENMRGAFAVTRPEDVHGRDVLLVDDVLTTGTTASECARTLRRAGAERVFVATVARVLKPETTRVALSSNQEVRPLETAAHV